MIGRILLRTAAEQGDAPALIHDGQSISHSQLAVAALRWATLLEKSVDAREMNPVAVRLPNTPDSVLIVAALMVLGIPVLPLNPQWCPEEIARSLGGLALSGIVTADGDLPVWRACPAFVSTPLVGLEDLRERAAFATPLAVTNRSDDDSGDRPALVLMTSGTTGTPKPVVRSQNNLLANARQVGEALGWAAGHRVLSVTPFHHANGFSNGLLLPLLRGGCIVSLARFFPATLARLLRDERVDTLIASPVVYRAMLACDEGTAVLGLLKECLSSGAPLPDDVALRAARQASVYIRELYGSSETGTVSIEPPRQPDEPRSAGLPVPGVEVAILTENGRRLPHGLEGLVAVRSPAVMRGYWTPDGIDPARSDDGWYLIGDRGLIDGKGELHLCGRFRAFVNVGGNKVDPREIEAIIREIDGVVRCRVDGRPDDRGTEEVCAEVFLRSGSGLDRTALLAHMRRQLAEYKLPRRIELHEYIPPALPDKHTDVSAESDR